MEKLKNKNLDFIVFPELAISFSSISKFYFNNINSPIRKLFLEMAFIKKSIIIPGTFYLNSRNMAPVIFPTMEINYVAKQTLSLEEDSSVPEMAVIKGNINPLFITNKGKFSVLICRDLLNGNLLQSVLNLKPDIIFNPCANKDILRFNKESSLIVQNNNIFIIQPNIFYNEKYPNSSSIYSILHKKHIEDSKLKGYKKTEEPYEIYSSAKNENEIVIVELDLLSKRVSIPSIGSDSSNVPTRIIEVIKLDHKND